MIDEPKTVAHGIIALLPAKFKVRQALEHGCEAAIAVKFAFKRRRSHRGHTSWMEHVPLDKFSLASPSTPVANNDWDELPNTEVVPWRRTKRSVQTTLLLRSLYYSDGYYQIVVRVRNTCIAKRSGTRAVNSSERRRYKNITISIVVLKMLLLTIDLKGDHHLPYLEKKFRFLGYRYLSSSKRRSW